MNLLSQKGAAARRQASGARGPSKTVNSVGCEGASTSPGSRHELSRRVKSDASALDKSGELLQRTGGAACNEPCHVTAVGDVWAASEL